MSLFEVTQDAAVRLPESGLYALFSADLVRDECSDGYRLWVITDRDERTIEVSDFISWRFVESAIADTERFQRLIKSAIDRLMGQMLDHMLSSGWRLLAEPLGLKTQTGEEP